MRNLRLSRLAIYVVLVVLCTLALAPFYWTFSLSTHKTAEIYSSLPLGLGGALAENWNTLTAESYFYYGYMNSIIVGVTSTGIAILVSSMAGYAFAKFDFRFKRAVFTLVLASMMIPFQLGLVAFVWEMIQIGWANSLLPFIIPGVGANAFGIFWMSKYIEEAIPDEMLDAARIDGCSEIGIFVRIILPLVLPASLSFGLVNFVWSWNAFLLPSLLLDDPTVYTLPLVLRNLGNLYRQDYGAQFLGVTLGTLPLIGMFIFTSRRMIAGLTAGAVKG